MDAETEQDPFSDFNSDQFPSSPDPTPSQPSGIVMVSPEFGGETVPAEAIVDAFEGSETEVIVLYSTDSGDEMATSNLAADSPDVVTVGKIDAVRKNGDIQVNKGKRRLENSCLCTSLEDSVELKCSEVVKDRKTPLKTDGKRIETIDDFRRQSLEGKGKNAVKSKSGLLDFLDVLKVVVGDMNGGCDCEEVDFLGTAKKGGFTFPRPRWWPAEGDDQ